MDEDLFQILSHPFTAGGVAGVENDELEETVVLQSNALKYVTGEKSLLQNDLENFELFRNDPPLVFEPHIHLNDTIREVYLSARLTDHHREAVQSVAPELEHRTSELVKYYKIYIQTATEDGLSREALRLERKYFDEPGKYGQIPYIKIKRYFEKIKTFNEFCRNHWREIFKILDSLELHSDLEEFRGRIPSDLRVRIYPMIRLTDAFLDSLKRYLKVEAEVYDTMTRAYRVDMVFDPELRYSLEGFFGDPPDEEEISSREKTATEEDEGEEEAEEDLPPEVFEGSIARSIILETREHRLAGSRILSVPILGSRDWNRTPDYRLEVPLEDYEACLETFRIAYHVNVPETLGKLPTNQNTALGRKGTGARYQQAYGTMVQEILGEIRRTLLEEDYPGLDKPSIFLYHTGPLVFYRILLAYLRQRNLGEMFYMQERNPAHEFPLPLIKKETIFWWNGNFSGLDGEEVDSYLYFSRILEMVKKDFRILFEEGSRMRKKEQPGAGYSGLDRWIRENRVKVFGVRKVEVFRRFIPGSQIDEENAEDSLMARLLEGEEEL